MSGTDGLLRERLRQLSRELEEIASEQEFAAPRRQHRVVPGEDIKTEWWMEQVDHLYASRRLRERYLPPSFFGEPAWDILLELFMLDLRGRNASVKTICHASAVAPTTALRWIDILSQHGLIGRVPTPPGDMRMTWWTLTAAGDHAIRNYILAMTRMQAQRTPELLLIEGGRDRG